MSFDDIRSGNPLKERLAAGGTAVGSFVRMGSTEVVEVAGHAGCDFVLIDMEHSLITWELAGVMAMAAESANTVPIIRVPHGARDVVTRALDVGGHGVMVAQVESADEAAAIVAATRYGPGGTRGAARTRRSGFGMAVPFDEFVEAANRSTFVSVQIESVAAVDDVAAIAAVPGLDCLFVGLSDLAVDLDRAGKLDDPVVLEAFRKVQAACDDAGIACGIPTGSAEAAEPYLAAGARLVATGDTGALASGMRAFVQEVRRSSD